MNAYSPFSKSLNEIEVDDLKALREASEGWYIEYKREIPNAASIAKSISAFANTYGGWLFYGIIEKSKEESVAGSYIGIAKSDVDAGMQRIRQAVATLINPSPHFDTKIVWGPHEDIDLGVDQAIICIHTPWSATAPHIHKSGLIYRRVSDGSEPKPETDKHLLEQLWQRSRVVRKIYDKWVSRKPDLSREEKNFPYLRLLISTDLWLDRNLWTDAPIDIIRDILSQKQSSVISIPFDTVYSSSRGYIGRQLNGNDPHRMGITWEFSPSLWSDIIIPLNFYSYSNTDELLREFEGYKEAGRYVKYIKSKGYKHPRVVDLNFLFNILTAIAETNHRLLDLAGWQDGFYIKARLINVWRTVPFLDVSLILDEIEKYGLPMVMNKTVTTPPGTEPDTFDFIETYSDVEDKNTRMLIQAMNMFGTIARSFGIPAWIKTNDDETPYYRELQLAGFRAFEVQNIRKKRENND